MAAKNKTVQTAVDPSDFLAGVEHDTRRADAETLLKLMSRLTGYTAKMWGPTILHSLASVRSSYETFPE